MKKIIKILLFLLLVNYTNICCASCPINKNGQLTGSACTIEEAGNTQKNKNLFEIFNKNSKIKKDLKQNNSNQESQTKIIFDYDKNCPFGCTTLEIFKTKY